MKDVIRKRMIVAKNLFYCNGHHLTAMLSTEMNASFMLLDNTLRTAVFTPVSSATAQKQQLLW